MCPDDLEPRPIYTKIGSRDQDLLLNTAVPRHTHIFQMAQCWIGHAVARLLDLWIYHMTVSNILSLQAEKIIHTVITMY